MNGQFKIEKRGVYEMANSARVLMLGVFPPNNTEEYRYIGVLAGGFRIRYNIHGIALTFGSRSMSGHKLMRLVSEDFNYFKDA